MTYYTDTEISMMTGAHETMIACGISEDESWDLSYEALNIGDDIPMSEAEMKYGKVSFEVCNHRVTVFYKECHQYFAGQRHLRTYCRKTYVSSRWYQCMIENLSTHKTKWFKTKIGEDRLAAFTKAIDKALLAVIS